MAQGRSTKVISMIQWIQTCGLSMNNSLCGVQAAKRGAWLRNAHLFLSVLKDLVFTCLIDSGRGSARAKDDQGTPTQSHISLSIF
jgi:hypothetical protein